MSTLSNRKCVIAFVILLICSMTASTLLIPASAQNTPLQIATSAYVQATPNPVGVGQIVIVYMWIDEVIYGASLGNDIRAHNYQLTITAPDGANETERWAVVSDPTSNQAYSFAPNQTGTYTFTFNYPGQIYTWSGTYNGMFPFDLSAYTNDTYMPSSATTTLAVQAAPTGTSSSAPLPTTFWTYPIYGENTNWASIASNWLGDGYPGYLGGYEGWDLQDTGDAIGSQTAHIMWTTPLQSGGVVGGNNSAVQSDTYFDGSAYLGRFNNPIVVDGMLIYTTPLSFGGVSDAMTPQPYGPTVCASLVTGKVIWSSSNVPAPSFAYIYDVQDPNQHGVFPPMIISVSGTTWEAFDADTGTPLFNVTNIPSGVTAAGPMGEILSYSFTNYGTTLEPNYYLSQWNSSQLWGPYYDGASTIISVVPPITDGSNPSMFNWNISIPSLNKMTYPPTILQAFSGNMLICLEGNLPGMLANLDGPVPVTSPYTYFAINLNPTKGVIGSILWTNTVQPPTGNVTVGYNGAEATADNGIGVFTEYYVQTMQYVGYSMATGKQIWGPTSTEIPMNYYDWMAQKSALMGEGNLYVGGVGGLVYCYDLSNGNLLWTYGNGGEGNDTSSGVPYPGQYPNSIVAIGNGVLYLVTSQHQVETPIYKGGLITALNASTGAQLWTLSDVTNSYFSLSSAIASGYTAFFNSYDNQIYVTGRGPSETTVNAPLNGVTTSTPITITGSVIDISAGTTQTEQAADFPHGVPVSSDASMTQWMEYVYQQQAEPSNFTGVPVVISVLDSNNNCRIIGTATTDASGTYSLTWTPDIAGNFTVYANFAGTSGYWPSSAETHFYAGLPTTTTVPTTSTLSGLASTNTVMLGVAAIIVVIIIGIAVLALIMLRKRPIAQP